MLVTAERSPAHHRAQRRKRAKARKVLREWWPRQFTCTMAAANVLTSHHGSSLPEQARVQSWQCCICKDITPGTKPFAKLANCHLEPVKPHRDQAQLVCGDVFAVLAMHIVLYIADTAMREVLKKQDMDQLDLNLMCPSRMAEWHHIFRFSRGVH